MTNPQQNTPVADQILTFWEKDSKFDRYNPAEESAKISSLHFKYLKLYKQCLSSLITLRDKKNKLFLKKNNFYSGKDDPSVYREKNFHIKVLKVDMDMWISSDDEYSAIASRITEFENCVDILKSILDQIKNRHWISKTIVEYDKFTSGA